MPDLCYQGVTVSGLVSVCKRRDTDLFVVIISSGDSAECARFVEG